MKRQIDWKAFYPRNLPKTPAGRLDLAQELIKKGFISLDEARKILDIPSIPNLNPIGFRPYKGKPS